MLTHLKIWILRGLTQKMSISNFLISSINFQNVVGTFVCFKRQSPSVIYFRKASFNVFKIGVENPSQLPIQAKFINCSFHHFSGFFVCGGQTLNIPLDAGETMDDKEHIIHTRDHEKYRVQHATTSRLKQSFIKCRIF